MSVDHYLTIHNLLVLVAILCAVFVLFPPKHPSVAKVQWRDWSWLLFLLAVFFV